jgi:hypothetical protein
MITRALFGRLEAKTGREQEGEAHLSGQVAAGRDLVGLSRGDRI